MHEISSDKGLPLPVESTGHLDCDNYEAIIKQYRTIFIHREKNPLALLQKAILGFAFRTLAISKFTVQ